MDKDFADKCFDCALGFGASAIGGVLGPCVKLCEDGSFVDAAKNVAKIGWGCITLTPKLTVCVLSGITGGVVKAAQQVAGREIVD